jgi:TatD DNase family protein
MLDAHCHIGFLADMATNTHGEGENKNLSEMIDYIESNTSGALDMSTSPDGYAHSTATFSAAPKIHPCAGLHPWLVSKLASKEATSALSSNTSQLERTLKTALPQMATTPFIGEIGLDFSPRVLAARPTSQTNTTLPSQANTIKETQMRALERILNCIAQHNSRKVISMHCVHAAYELIELSASAIQRSPQSIFIMHRFGGTSDELTAAIKAGFWFSVGMQSLSTKRGRAYLRQIPRDRLLIETDLPQKEGETLNVELYRAALESTLATMRDILGSDIQSQLEANESHLLSIAQ